MTFRVGAKRHVRAGLFAVPIAIGTLYCEILLHLINTPKPSQWYAALSAEGMHEYVARNWRKH